MAKRKKAKSYDDGYQPDLLGGPPVPALKTPRYVPPCDREPLAV